MILYFESILQDATVGATTDNQPSAYQTQPTVDEGAFIYPSPAYCSTIGDGGFKVDGTIKDDGFKLDAAC